MFGTQTGGLGSALLLGIHLATAQAHAEVAPPRDVAPTRAQGPANTVDAGVDADEAGLPTSVRREALVRIALRRNPGLAAVTARARAMRAEGEAEGRLPAPMVEAQIWQVPFRRPHRIDQAGMTMIGFRQEFTPGGARAARARAAREEASVEDGLRAQDAWTLARDVEHAFADYVEASELVEMHHRHKAAAERLGALARARYTAGAALADIAQSDREIAMISADHVTAQRMVELARARINGLLTRDAAAPLGRPVAEPRETTHVEIHRLLRGAEGTRPELLVARRKRDAARAVAEAEREIAKVPTLSVGAYYFPPSEPMPTHGFGVSLSSTLPWLWGDGGPRSRAAQLREDAASLEQQAARARVSLEVMTAAAEVAVRASELEALEREALPASRRAEQATLAGYEAGRAEIMGFLMATTAVYETEVSIVRARAALAHALTDLRWATAGFAQEISPAQRNRTP